MYIRTEETPNPETLKFIPGHDESVGKSYAFDSADEALISPLAVSIFAIDTVEKVFLGADFISITKKKDEDWFLIKPEILSVIMEHYVTGQPVVLNEKQDEDASDENDSKVVKEIKEVIHQKVRPAVANDGGDIIFRNFDDATGTVYLELQGACSGCPSSTVTLKNGVERLLSHYVPEVKAVEEFVN